VEQQTNPTAEPTRQMFRAAAKAVTEDEDAELDAEKRRRRGEAEGAFQQFTMKFSRHLGGNRASRTYQQPVDYLAETLDSLNLYYWEDSGPDGAEIDATNNAPQDYYPLQL
jgi:hypothetical protein